MTAALRMQLAQNSNTEELLPSWHPGCLRPFLTFPRISPPAAAFSPQAAFGPVIRERYVPGYFQRSPLCEDPNDVADAERSGEAKLNQFQWQWPTWSTEVWGTFIKNHKFGQTSLDTPPATSSGNDLRLRRDVEAHVAGILAGLQVPRGEDCMSMTAANALPPAIDHVHSLIQTQARHLRIAMLSATEIRHAWNRALREMSERVAGVGIVSIGDGDLISEIQMSNRQLRAQLNDMRTNFILERRKRTALETASKDLLAELTAVGGVRNGVTGTAVERMKSALSAST